MLRTAFHSLPQGLQRGMYRFERSRWFRVIVVAATLLVFGAAVAVITQQQRADLERQIVSRDAELLAAVTGLYLQTALKESGSDRVDETSQFAAVLKTSSLKGVIGARLFTPDGKFDTSFPINVADADLSAADVASLRQQRPVTHFRAEVPLSELFLDAPVDPARAGRTLPMLEVNIPLQSDPLQPASGFAQFVIEGHTVAREFALLGQNLFRRALLVYALGALAIIAAVWWAFGRLQRVNQILLERTDRLQRANQELALSAKTSALGSVAAHLVHGMKNPLFGLQAIADERSRDAAASDEDWQVVSAAAQRLQNLISETVTILSEEANADRYEIPLSELMAQLGTKFEKAARGSEIQMEVSVSCEARVDNRTASLVSLVLTNLTQNALQASAPGCTVALQVGVLGADLEFRVSDQGSGIPDRVQRSLFSPCQSTKASGSGIGLAISRQLANHLGAELLLLQTGPTGSIFALRLPAERFHLQPSAPEPVAPRASAGVTNTGFARRVIPLNALAAAGLICVGMVSTSPALAQSPRWRWANPTPHGNHTYDSATGLGVSVQVGDRGQLHASSDLVAWQPLESGTTNALRSLLFFGSRLLITGERGTVLWADSLDDVQSGSLDAPTDDWLEGIASSGTKLVAVGDNGAIYQSDTGTNWTRRSVAFTTWLTSVTYGSSKGFVAVGDDGFVATSSSGSSWNTQKSGVTNSLLRVRFLNDSYYAVGTHGALLSSTDGQKWTLVPTGITNTLFDIAWNGASYVLVGDDEVRAGASPSALADMLAAARPSRPPRWTYYSAQWQGEEYLLSGRMGMTVHGYGSNVLSGDLNITWETHSDPVRNWLWEAFRLPTRYLVVGDLGTLMTSENGFRWSLELPPSSATNSVLLGVGGDTNTVVVVGSKGTILYSVQSFTNVVTTNFVVLDLHTTHAVVSTNLVNTLGILWAAASARPTTNDLQGIVRFQEAFVAVGGKGTVVRSIDEGKTWSLLPKASDSFLTGLTTFSNSLVAVGSRGVILTSTDASHWTVRASGTTNWIYRVRNLNGVLYAVGDSGTLLSSADGIVWESQATGTRRWLNDISYVEAPTPTWYVVGNQGTVLMKTSNSPWLPADSITQRSLYSVVHNEEGQLISVGIEGCVLRAQLTPSTQPIAILDFEPGASGFAFLLSGQTGQRFTLDRSLDIQSSTNWRLGPTLEFLDSSGTLLYVENEGTNAPSSWYFHARQIR